MARLRAVLFDLDGTLVNSLDDLADAMNAALADENLPTHQPVQYLYFVGDGLDNLVRRAAPPGRADDEELHARLVAGQRAHYRENWHGKTRPYPGIPELLARLAEREIPTAVLSNKPDDFTRLIAGHFFAGHPFRAVRGARAGTPIKPAPDGALAVAGEVGVPPAEWLYLGDTDTDMRTARAAGMAAAGVTWGFRPEAELLDAGAAFLLHSPGEALAHL